MMDTVDLIRASRIIAIARGIYGDELFFASRALYDGGIRAFEVTFEQDRHDTALTSESVSALRRILPRDAAVGAGTVLSGEQVRAAREAGAEFIISPNTSREVIEETKRLGMASIPGAMTPTEIAAAYSFGADIVKVFPAGILGIDYFKAVRAPLAHIPLAAVAGITPENIGAFYRAGAVAFGISSTLYKKDAIRSMRFDELTVAARAFYAALDG